MDKWDLLHIGTAYIEVHTFKWKDYVTVRDFSTTTNALSKEILQLEEENKNLEIEIWWLMWERDGLKMVVERLHKEIEEQDKEYCKLKEEIETLNMRLDNKEKLNEEYRKQIDKYKRQYEHSMWEDDELIYEEWLYE